MPEVHSWIIFVPSGETSEHRWGTEIKHKIVSNITLIKHPGGHKPMKPMSGKGGKKK